MVSGNKNAFKYFFFYVSNMAAHIERFLMVKRYANVTQQCH